MEITPEVRTIKAAYMKAKEEKNQPEMDRLRAKAMAATKPKGQEGAEGSREKAKENTMVYFNEDGDSAEIKG